MLRSQQRGVLPGFRLTLGYTLLYLSLIVIIPLAATFVKSSELSWAQFSQTVFSPPALAAYRLSFGASFLAAAVNAIFGFIVAWVLVRYDFFGKQIVDALVDLPFALPTAVAGITLATLYAPNGWLGGWLAPFGIKVSYTQLGIFIALTFIGLPFIVRTVQPVLADLDSELEEAAASLGANRWQAFWRVIFPMLSPALLTGFSLAFARALGEYGSVVFISSNIPMKTQIVPLLIMGELDGFHLARATALAVVMLVISFLLLLAINLLQWWSNRYNATNPA
ncbi:MAG TPA: sulfate ABC transporter permease subunit CysT [Verrucomicrobiae bacterium]|nr:sulfate ABC transporter permease subunit CysT [Verrucomicrobiae bacterium]